MNPQNELSRLEEKLKDAHSRVQAGGEDAEQAKIEAQAAADGIRRIMGVEAAYAPKKEDTANDLSRQLVGGASTVVYGAKKGLEDLFTARSEKQAARDAQIISEAIKQSNAPRTPTERMMQGTIDPETGATGRARQTGYNQMTSEQAKASASNQRVLDQLKRTGVITGENPILKAPGFTASTPTGISVTPQSLPMPPPAAPTVPVTQPSFLDKAKIKGMNLVGKVAPFLGAYGIGSQSMDALNRGFAKDPIGATISGIGALGAFAGTKPGPQMIPGLAVSGIAELINKYRDNPQKVNEMLQSVGKEMPVMPYADGGLVGGLSSLQQPSALTAQMAQQTPPNLGLPPVHSLDMMSSPNSAGSRPFPDQYNPNMRYAPPFKEGGSTTPAWQRKEGKSPSGGLNAVGRASYKRETGGELKAPQPEGGSRKKSFCARMGGMKKKLTSSKTANDPDSRINKALRKWKC